MSIAGGQEMIDPKTGRRRSVHTDAIAGHTVFLEKTDNTTTSWGPGHAEWVCERCGARGQTSHDLAAQACHV